MNALYIVLLCAAFAVIELLIGGTRLLFSLPAYLILAFAAVAGPPNAPATRAKRLTYVEQLRDVRWKRRRDDLLRRSNYTCCESGEPSTTGTMDLQVHHVVYINCLDPWDYPDELLLVVCNWHHRERQAVEQVIYAEVGKHLATLDLHEMRRQPIYAFFEDDSTLDCFPRGSASTCVTCGMRVTSPNRKGTAGGLRPRPASPRFVLRRGLSSL